MNVLIINGSARKDGFCNHIANLLEKEFKRKGKTVNVSYYNIPEKKIVFCKGCVECCSDENKYCFINDDINEAYKLMEEASSIIYISPIYESFISGVLKNFFDRTNHYTSFFKLAGKNINLILTGAQPLRGRTKEFSNLHVVNNINRYFEHYSIITHTHYTYLGFFHHLSHHTSMDEETEKMNRKTIKDITNKVIKQKIDYKKVMSSKNAYKV